MVQMESQPFPFTEKVKIFQLLKEANVRCIQIGSFVHPKLAPQMANTDELIRNLTRTPGGLLTGLVLNEKVLERTLA